MPFSLDQVVPWGRSFGEYCRMFGLTDGDLARAYKSTVDPRLNYEQAMEIAMRIGGLQ